MSAAGPLFVRLGTSDEVLCCDCCGNTDLSHTVALEHCDTGATVYFGSVCAVAACHPWARLSDRYATFRPGSESDDEE
jgi:hypothetical protein